jgi:hypothetical protein
MKRQCGNCELCCKLLPMAPGGREYRAMAAMIDAGLATPNEFVGMLPEWEKAAGVRCKYQKHGKGWAVYARRPMGCRMWNCRWLVDDAGDTSRPDHCHYVIDIMPDVIRMVPNDGGAWVEIPVIVIWCNPKYPNAHRDPALRRYLAHKAETEHLGALIRFSESDGMALLAPCFDASGGGEWLERRSNMASTEFKGLHQRILDGEAAVRRMVIEP